MGPRSIWDSLSDADRDFDLEAMMEGVEQSVRISVENGKQTNLEQIESVFGVGEENEVEKVDLDRKMIEDKVRYFLDVEATFTNQLLDKSTFVYSKTHRVRNVLSSDGEHLFSPRMRDGGLSLTLEGAKRLHGTDIPTVVVNEDSVPFTRKGRNVMHGFILDVKGDLTPGLPCLIEDQNGIFIGHGVALCTRDEVAVFSKGIAIKVRDGIGE